MLSGGDERRPAHELGRGRLERAADALPASWTAPVGVMCMSSSRNGRNGSYGVVAEYGSHTSVSCRIVGNGVRAPAAGATFRVRDRPRSRRAARFRTDAASAASSRTASSASRARDGNVGDDAAGCVVRTGPTLEACTGCAFPFTRKGSSVVVSNVTEERSSTGRVARSSPGAARAITRAARFTVSPITVYVRRNSGPMSPANTSPRLTPTCRGSTGPASTTSRSADEHPLLVVLRRAGHARGEDDLAAVAIDVAAEEGDPVAIRRAVHHRHEHRETVRHLVDALRFDHRFDAGEPQERDGRTPVLGFVLVGEERSTQSFGHAPPTGRRGRESRCGFVPVDLRRSHVPDEEALTLAPRRLTGAATPRPLRPTTTMSPASAVDSIRCRLVAAGPVDDELGATHRRDRSRTLRCGSPPTCGARFAGPAHSRRPTSESRRRMPNRGSTRPEPRDRCRRTRATARRRRT